jgi:hypothetical protein
MAVRPSPLDPVDKGAWATKLNAHLDVALDAATGDLKSAAVQAALGGSLAAPVLFDTSGGMLPSTDSFTTRALIGIDRVNDRMLVAGRRRCSSTTRRREPVDRQDAAGGRDREHGAEARPVQGQLLPHRARDGVGARGVWKAAPQPATRRSPGPRCSRIDRRDRRDLDGFNVITDATAANDLAMIFGEYADPTGGPQIWRTTDGTTWTSVLAAQPTIRHFHCIAAGPVQPGERLRDRRRRRHEADLEVDRLRRHLVGDRDRLELPGRPDQLHDELGVVRRRLRARLRFIMDRATNTPHWLPGFHRYFPVASPLDTRAGGQRLHRRIVHERLEDVDVRDGRIRHDVRHQRRRPRGLLPGALPPNTYITGVGSSTSVQVSATRRRRRSRRRRS